MAEQFLAQISIVSFNFAPKGWAFCNGQLLPISQNTALFSLLGTTYGGDGIRTFALPNFQGRTAVGVSTDFALGQVGGEASVTLTTPNLPAHSHTPTCSSGNANARTTTGKAWAASSANPYSPAPSGAMSAQAIGNTGGSQPHDNMQPYLVLNFVIALFGIFPSRN